MKTISRYIMTLALLITAVGGAWADEKTINWTIGNGDDSGWGGSVTQNGIKIQCNSDDAKVANSNPCFFECYESSEYVTFTISMEDGSDILGVNMTLAENGDAFQNLDGWTGSGDTRTWTGKAKSVDLRVNRKGYYDEFENWQDQYLRVSALSVTVDAPAIEPAIEVTTNAASEQDLFTEASFNMPAFDATADYELVRDLAQQTSVNLIIGTGDAATTVTADTRLRIVKNNNVYVPISALSCTFSDEIENNTILPTGFNDAKLTPQFYLQGENEEWTLVTDINTTTHLPNNLQPGQVYCMTLKAAEGSNYDGETPKSFTITLFQGYEVTVGAGEYATFYKDEALCVEDEDAELYTITEVNATEAVLSSKIDVIAAGTPMLIFNKGTEANTFLLIPTTDQADAVTAADQFQGTLDAVQMPASTEGRDYYVCTGNAFVWVKSAGTIAANRCWLEIIAQPAGVRANTRSIVSGGDTTNIDATTRDALEGDYYDLQGRKVEKPLRKGVYIKSGKKVIKH